MAKAKNGGGGSVHNRAIYSRVSFLQQAAAFLSSDRQAQSSVSYLPAEKLGLTPKATDLPAIAKSSTVSQDLSLQGVARRLATDLRAVSLKTRIRLTPTMKQTTCKFCDSILIEGQTCTSQIENKSKGGRKPWADVLVRRCHTCERERRYPVNTTRPQRKTGRGGSSGIDNSPGTQSQHQEAKSKQGG